MQKLRIGLVATFSVFVIGALVMAQSNEGDPSSRAAEYFQQITEAPYTDWAFQPGVPEGYYVGQQPHGMVLRSFVNDVALQDIEGTSQIFSDGAIIVKENHMPGEVDASSMEAQAPVEDFGGNLAVLTFMVKQPGFNPDAGDWFWVRALPDGTIEGAGIVEGCVACHSQVADNDYVFNSALGGN